MPCQQKLFSGKCAHVQSVLVVSGQVFLALCRSFKRRLCKKIFKEHVIASSEVTDELFLV